ncbi:MAG: hypothetical protein INQ03_10775 [Candidatus Heimdallarchaeota archaeon]|nr:hypothetical protein [Candidatus Heimdallarchaeota archaeon]
MRKVLFILLFLLASSIHVQSEPKATIRYTVKNGTYVIGGHSLSEGSIFTVNLIDQNNVDNTTELLIELESGEYFELNIPLYLHLDETFFAHNFFTKPEWSTYTGQLRAWEERSWGIDIIDSDIEFGFYTETSPNNTYFNLKWRKSDASLDYFGYDTYDSDDNIIESQSCTVQPYVEFRDTIPVSPVFLLAFPVLIVCTKRKK